jgi:hypothetical protein
MEGAAMKKLLFAGAAILSPFIAAPAFAADFAILAAPVPVFSWTSCFLGAHIGGAWAQDGFTDPAATPKSFTLIALSLPHRTLPILRGCNDLKHPSRGAHR